MKGSFLLDSITHLVNMLNKSEPSKLDYTIAANMLANLRDIAEGTIQDAADICYVSSPTISRFVKKLGFDNYNSFKYKLSCDLYALPHFDFNISELKNIGDTSVKAYYIDKLRAQIERIDQLLSDEMLDDICRWIHEAPQVFIHSLPDVNFTAFQANMAMCGKLVHHVTGGTDSEEFRETITDKTVVFAALYATSKTLQTVKQLKLRNAKVISLCRGNDGVLDKYSDIYISLDGLSEDTNHYSINFIFDIIMLAYYQKYHTED